MSSDLASHTSARRRFVPYVVPSDYMSPTLEAGDVVEIDTSITAIGQDGIYLFEFSTGEPALRRAQVVLGAAPSLRVWLSTDCAPECRDEMECRSIRVLGRAIRAMREHRL